MMQRPTFTPSEEKMSLSPEQSVRLGEQTATTTTTTPTTTNLRGRAYVWQIRQPNSIPLSTPYRASNARTNTRTRAHTHTHTDSQPVDLELRSRPVTQLSRDPLLNALLVDSTCSPVLATMLAHLAAALALLSVSGQYQAAATADLAD